MPSAWCSSPEQIDHAALPQRPLTFGCFNNSAKLSPACVELFASVLRALPAARLQLKAFGFADAPTRDRVVARFVEHGVSAWRLSVLPPEREPHAHLQRYREIDIALDTWPYHGTTTTCEALSMGVPVLCLAGSKHASRVGVSLLSQLGTSDWIARDRAGFVANALRLSAPGALAAARDGLAERFRRALCDGPRFAAEFGERVRESWRER